ncbi:hypothetical protein BV20DRAFT_1060431 [Pilatotrama ljubarskyi]|nr:hypothetical protein BV20DRAFT_1060431 [Pilatotrama ljubarskyi]
MHLFTAAIPLAALFATIVAGPIVPGVTEHASSALIISDAEMAHWLASTDAVLTFIGDLPNPLAERSAEFASVTFCTKSIGPICGGTCTVYNGFATCLDAAGTACISATGSVDYCDAAGCSGTCRALSLCGSPMESGFCSTPNTQSIRVNGWPF